MSSMSLSMRIGAVVDGSLNRVLGGVNRDLDRLGSTTTQLQARQERLARIMERGMRSGNRDLTRFRREQERVTRAIEETRRAQERLNRSTERERRIGEAQSKAGGNFASSTAQLAGFGLAIAAPIRQAIEFESAMAEVGKTVEFSAGNSLPKLGEELKQLSLQIPLSANELATITAAGGQLGVADKDLIGFTTTVAKMGVAFDMSAEQAGDAMAKLSNVMQVPIAEMDRIGDMINTISNNSPAKAREIVAALSQVGSAVKSAGYSEEFSVGLTGALIAQGREASVTSNAIESMITSFSTLDMATKRQIVGFNKLGINHNDFAKRFKEDGQAATLEFFDLVNQLPTEERTGVVSSIIGLNYGGDILALANNTALLGNNLDLLGTNADGTAKYLGSMNAEFDSISATKANEIQLLKNNLNVLAITVGNALLPALGDAITAITPVIQSFAAWAKANPELIAGTVKIVGGLLLAKVAFWGVSFAVLSVIRPIASLMTLFNRLRAGITVLRNMAILGQLSPILMKLGAAFKFVGGMLRAVGLAAMANPLFIAIGLLAVAGYLIYRNWTPIKAFFINLWNGIKSAAIRGVAAIRGALGRFNPMPIFSRAWRSVTSFFTSTWNRLKAFSQSGIRNILATIASFTPLGLFIRAFSAVFGYFGGLAARFRQYGVNMIQGLIGGITAKFGELKAKMSEMASSVSGGFKSALGIKSPSRVFMGYGQNIAEGVAIGIGQKADSAVGATQMMAGNIIKQPIAIPSINLPKIATNDSTYNKADDNQIRFDKAAQSSQTLARQATGATGGNVIHFSPTIHVGAGNSADTQAAVNSAMTLAYDEFASMMRRYEHDNRRRAF